MILNDFTVPRTKYSNEQLDAVLVELCEIVLQGQQDNPDFNGLVAAAVIDPKGRLVTGLNYLYGVRRVHAERAAVDKYEAEYGELPPNSIVVSTLTPCSQQLGNRGDLTDHRVGCSCTEMLNHKHIKLAYCGYNDPSQKYTENKFVTVITENSKLKELCKKIAHVFLDKDITEETNKQVLSYVKKIHPKGEFKIDSSITNHPVWELTSVPIDSLHIEEEGSPYGQISYVDYDHVADITAQDIKAKPIVVDNEGWIIDGNHRAVAAREMGLKSIPAYVPDLSAEEDQETYDQHMARVKREREVSENFADGKGPGRPGDSQRHGIPKDATMAQLEKASHAKGRKGQLARWQLNMRRGKKK